MNRFLFAPSRGHALALFRIVLGIFLLSETLSLAPSLNDLFGPHGFLDAGLMQAISGKSLPLYAAQVERWGISYPLLLQAVFALRVISILCFLVGAFTFSSTFVLWLSQVFFMASGSLSSYGLDRYFHVFLFLLLFLPAGRVWSWDARKNPDPGPAWEPTFGLRILQLALLITYFNAGYAKAQGPDWWSGESIWRAVNLPEFRHFNFTWMAMVPWLPKMIGISTVVLETFYPVAVWIPGLGLIWTFAIMGMHFGIAATMGLVNFGLGLAFLNAALFLFPRLRASSLSP